MTRTHRTFLLLLCFCGLSVGGGRTPAPTPRTSAAAAATVNDDVRGRTCKASTPIVIDGVTASDRASIDVTFLSDATDVQIRLWGVDGVVLQSEPITGNFAAGQTISLTPALTPGRGGSIAIDVAGTFDGRRQNALSGFEVPSVGGGRARSATVRLDARGDRVRVLTAHMGS